MKKFLSVALVLLTFVALLVSCSDSDKAHKEALVGTWELRTDTSSEVVTIEFKSNNKYEYTRSFANAAKEDQVEEGKYTIVDGTVTLISKDDQKTILSYEYDDASATITYLSDYKKVK